MTWAEIETNWDTFAPQLQDRWGRLTNDDLIDAREGRDQLLRCIHKRYRIDTQTAERHVDDWINSVSELSVMVAHPRDGRVEAGAAEGDRLSR